MTSFEIFGPLCSELIPDLNEHNHKGQSGRIGIIGGSKEFTGAPYYAAISSLKIGADLVYVFCTSDSAGPIKSYSPELIVLPVLDSKDMLVSVSEYMPRLHSLIIGPGLGRDEALSQPVLSLIVKACEFNLPLLLDADGLYFLSKKLDVIKNYRNVILTPNAIEFSRLFKLLFQRDLTPQELNDPKEAVSEMCSKLGNITIVRKGRQDFISDGNLTLSCDQFGSNRRCGGQGDLLVGSMATFSYWSQIKSKPITFDIHGNQVNPCLIAAYAACLFTRKCNKLAFDRFGRTMTMTDMIKLIPAAFESLFPSKFKS